MVQTGSNDSSLRLMGMLMTISLGIFAVLFLYVLYNMTVNVAGTTIAMLFFIVLAFFIVLMKTFKLLNRLANPVSRNIIIFSCLPLNYADSIWKFYQVSSHSPSNFTTRFQINLLDDSEVYSYCPWRKTVLKLLKLVSLFKNL